MELRIGLALQHGVKAHHGILLLWPRVTSGPYGKMVLDGNVPGFNIPATQKDVEGIRQIVRRLALGVHKQPVGVPAYTHRHQIFFSVYFLAQSGFLSRINRHTLAIGGLPFLHGRPSRRGWVVGIMLTHGFELLEK